MKSHGNSHWRSILRTRLQRTSRATLLAGTVLAAGALAQADTLILKNGQSLDGRVLEENERTVKFQDVRRMVLVLPLDTIERIERGKNPLVLEEEGDKALKEKDYEGAIDIYREAIDIGGDAKRLEHKMADAVRLMEERDLGPWADDVKAIRRMLAENELDGAEARVRGMLAAMPETSAMREMARELLSTVHYRRALNLIDSIDYFSAERELRSSLELNPFNFEACVQLADLYSQVSSRRGQAIDLYKRVLEDGQQTLDEDRKFEITDKIARLYVQQNDYANALQYFGAIYEQRPDFRSGLGTDYVGALRRVAEDVDTEDPQKAIDSLDRALLVQPYNDELRSELARNLLAIENYDRAIEEYLKLLDSDPNYHRANHNLASAYTAKGELGEARVYLRREIENTPGNYDAIVDLGDILIQMGDYEQAQAYYRQAREIEPNLTRATVALAASERLLGNYPAARRYLQELLARNEDDIETNLEMGRLAKDEKKYDEATKFLDIVVTLIEELPDSEEEEHKTDKADALLARGEVKLLTKGPSTATGDFNKALEVYPDYPAAYFNIGAAYEKKYNSSKEIADLKLAEENMLKARELDPANPEFAFGLGVLYHQVLASADASNEGEYFSKALENYRDYISNGGAQVSKVEGWISELSAGL
ncbi:MAG: hypothetical protein PWP23_243 [Candidatus Sumerlaeota bacterium]|nr:hypothetical protein [Candidatus Sumerlaeota bacterium]